mmetsp:Transcript_2030/g.4744  ORF Transcript_2030/g.4744 Transcript_2030/m.4744 type:complete len:370 (-) Transcript_2030:861-1970(-)
MSEKALEAILLMSWFAAVEKMANMERQPEWMLPAQVRIITSMQLSTSSLVSSLLERVMMVSNGVRKTRWKLKLDNSSFCRNLTDSCLRESMANMATSWFSCWPTAEKCFASMPQMPDHSMRLRRNMLPSATSTSFCREKTLGAAESTALSLPLREFIVELVDSSSTDTSHSAATKYCTELPVRLTAWENSLSTCTLPTTFTTISALASSVARLVSARLAPANSLVKGSEVAPALLKYPCSSLGAEKKMSSVRAPLANSCRRARRETPCSTCSHASSRKSPSAIATSISRRMQRTFLTFMSFTASSVVNLSIALTKVLRAVGKSRRHAMRIEYLNPSRHSSTMVSSSNCSRSWLSTPIMGGHTISNIERA